MMLNENGFVSCSKHRIHTPPLQLAHLILGSAWVTFAEEVSANALAFCIKGQQDS